MISQKIYIAVFVSGQTDGRYIVVIDSLSSESFFLSLLKTFVKNQNGADFP